MPPQFVRNSDLSPCKIRTQCFSLKIPPAYMLIILLLMHGAGEGNLIQEIHKPVDVTQGTDIHSHKPHFIFNITVQFY